VKSVAGTNTYVGDASYDALGRLDLILFGNSQQTDYVYYSHTQKGGRLYQLKTGTSGAPTATQSLEYDYDNVGNVARLKDYNNSNQVQSFSYDHLDRLTLAETNAAGADQYSESYGYNAIGNLTSKGAGSYSYDSTKKHAVRRVNGSGGSSQTVTIRAKGVYSGGWPQMKLRVNGTDRKTWTVSSSTYTNYSYSTTLTGRDVIEVVYTNDSGARSLYVDYVTVSGGTVQAEGGAMVYDRGTGNAAFDDQDVIAGQELLDVNGALRFVKGAVAYVAGYDANGNMTVRVVDGKAYLQTWDAENRLVTLTKGGTVTSFVYDGDGNQVKATVGDVTTAYVGNWYEWTGSGTSYYHFAGRRVAMRTSSGVTYIHGDHLGSATNTTGYQASSQRYYPYGAKRGTNTVVTPYRFTGQREESTIGLYFYNARWYDQVLGRFISADSIVPNPGDPQDLNRYSYVRNNPLRYTDPSGRCLQESEGGGRCTLLFELIEIILHTDRPGYPGQNVFNRQIWIAAREAGVAPTLVKAVVAAETGFDPNATSDTGAVGLMQLMPGTARENGLRVDDELDERYDSLKNLKAGAKYLRQQYDAFEDAAGEERWKLAATAYTAGLGTVRHAQQTIQEATSGSPWYGHDPNTFGGLTGTDATGRSPLSVAAVEKLEYPQNRAMEYVNEHIANYIHNIGLWLEWMRR